MKAFAIAFILCLINSTTRAADTTIVKLMQKVIELHIPANAPYYLLLDKAANPEMQNYYSMDLRWVKPEFKTNLPWDEFTNEMKADTSLLKWSDYNFPKARYITEKNYPKHNPFVRMMRMTPATTPKKVIDSLENTDQVIVLVRKAATKKQIALQEKKALARFRAKWPPESYEVFTFSKPIFSFNKQYAIISVELLGGGCHYVFKNQDGQWQLIASFSCKVS